MPDTEKYRNTGNLGREDDNFLGWKLGDIVHTAGSYITANKYGYCGYEEFNIPTGSRVRIIGIKQTDLNACYDKERLAELSHRVQSQSVALFGEDKYAREERESAVRFQNRPLPPLPIVFHEHVSRACLGKRSFLRLSHACLGKRSLN